MTRCQSRRRWRIDRTWSNTWGPTSFCGFFGFHLQPCILFSFTQRCNGRRIPGWPPSPAVTRWTPSSSSSEPSDLRLLIPGCCATLCKYLLTFVKLFPPISGWRALSNPSTWLYLLTKICTSIETFYLRWISRFHPTQLDPFKLGNKFLFCQ